MRSGWAAMVRLMATLLLISTLLAGAFAAQDSSDGRLDETPVTLLPEGQRLAPNGLAAEHTSGYFRVGQCSLATSVISKACILAFNHAA